ncbi:heme exporter protein CcmB [Commensalibacter melissae]|uniref:Heme exporter protein B n=1 Tax=Commensalibacter melissae TaxID=2070537 RepID=A0A318N1G1_9PROT|nr:heme exporter protein CcmB [Commensalibacter melissae]PXZ00191.1 heme exporter protein CcmB [Commensalibacter melissae]QGT69244.1 heme exporter protein CcmB [Commensalibacter melissae]
MPFILLLQREILLSFRHASDTVGTILFFILTATLFPLALGPEPQKLQQIAPAILWVCALLAALLPMERIYQQDYEDGSLDQFFLLGISPSTLAFTKMTGHWLCTGIPLLCASIPLTILYNLPISILPIFIISLSLGTACQSLVGGMTNSIALGAKKNSFLLPLLTFPLLTPVLIFGTMLIDAKLNNLAFLPNLQLLGACFAIALPFCPLAAGAGLRLAIE